MMSDTKNGWARRISNARNLGLCFLALTSSAAGDESGVRGTEGGTRTRRLDDEGKDQSKPPESQYRSYFMKKKELPQGRPTMHTYFDDTNSYAAVGAPDLLSAWEAAWNSAGWDTRVLNINDAQSHPDFHILDEALKAAGHGDISKYEKACFYRWFAMAAILPEDGNGGWMSDFDNFPLNIQPAMGHELPNGGEFTSYDGAVPDLMSGTKSEWDRITHFLTEFGIPNAFGGYVSDMNAFVHIRDKYGERAAHFESGRVVSGWGAKVVPGWGADAKFNLDCERIPGEVLAVHFSHHAMDNDGVDNGWFEAATGRGANFKNKKERDTQLAENRAKMASAYRNAWETKCLGVTDN